MTDVRPSTKRPSSIQFHLLFRGAVPTKAVRQEDNRMTLPAAFEIKPGLTGHFSQDIYTRLDTEGGCRSTQKSAAGVSYFHTGPSSRLTGLSNLDANEQASHECVVDFSRLTLGYQTKDSDSKRHDDGFRLEVGRLHADDTASRRMKHKGFWSGSFNYARGDISMPVSWGAVTSYAWSGDNALHLFKLEGAAMNGGAYGFNGDFYGSLRMEMTLKLGDWKPLISPYYSALTVAKTCSFNDAGCVQQGMTQSAGLYVDSPFGKYWGFIGATARRWRREEDAQFINDRISISYNGGVYIHNPEHWQLAFGLGRNIERSGYRLLADTTTELNGGIYVFQRLLLKGGLLLISGDTTYSTLYTGIESSF